MEATDVVVAVVVVTAAVWFDDVGSGDDGLRASIELSSSGPNRLLREFLNRFRWVAAGERVALRVGWLRLVVRTSTTLKLGTWAKRDWSPAINGHRADRSAEREKAD